MTPEIVVILLFVVATAVAILARRLRIPYTVALVAAGLLLGALHLLDAFHLTEALLFTVFLPGLIFEAAFHLEFRGLWRDRIAVGSLALPGVLGSVGITAALLVGTSALFGFAGPFTWSAALIFGALIAATDPIAVVAIFRAVGAPRRLSTLMEAESLFNDGTAIVVFSLVLALATGQALGAGELILSFLTVVGMGALVGGVLGIAIAQAIQWIDDPMIEITLTTLAAYGSFIVAEHLGFSGVIATVVAGLLCGNYAARTGMSPATRLAVESFWEYVAFALNSLVFLLIGLEVRIAGLAAAWQPIVIAYLAVLIARGVVTGSIWALLSQSRWRFPARWAALLTWGGLRGGRSLVLVLGLPLGLPARGELVAVTFGVVILTIMVNGLSMAPVMRRLGLGAEDSELTHDRIQASALITRAAINELERLDRAHFADPALIAAVREPYEQRLLADRSQLQTLRTEQETLARETRRRLHRHVMLAQMEYAAEALRAGTISRAAFDDILPELDAQILRLESTTSADGDGDTAT